MVCSFLSKAWSRWLCVGGLALALGGCSAGGSGAAAAPGAPATEVPVAPLKIPMPLDKAGHKIDVTFDIPAPPKGEQAPGYFLGLRMLFAPATGQVDIFEAHPVSIRVTMHRLEGGVERPVELGRQERVNSFYEPGQFAPFPIKNDVVVARGSFTEYSGAPPGTPDASTRVMLFAAPLDDSTGRYRLHVETLKDLPSLKGVKAFLAFEQSPKR